MESTEAEQLINEGKYFQARVLLEADHTIEKTKHAQLYALALSKSGVPEKGVEVLEPFYRANPDDTETAGILGGIYKELFKKKRSTELAIRSRDTYLQNFNQTKSYYTGINAATMSAISMQNSKSRAIAQEVISLIDENTSDFWELATLGEAHLLAKQKDKSRNAYLTARKIAGNHWGKVTSVYSQLWLLNHYIPVNGEILNIFLPPNVVAFVGHMIDREDRATKRFPPEIEPNVKEAIRSAIRSINAKVAYSSLACGSDIIFAEVMEEEGGELNLVLPFQKEDFVKESVRFAGADWEERFNRLVEKYTIHYITDDAYMGHDDLFAYLIRVIYGSSILRSAINHASPFLVSVLSQTDLNQKTGGTRDAIKAWTLTDRQININPDNFLPADSTGKPNSISARPVTVVERPVMFMFHARISDESIEMAHGLDEKLSVITELIKESTPSFIEQTDESIIVGTTSILTSIDFFQQVRAVLNERKVTFKTTFHSGPVYLPINSPDGTTNKELKMLNDLSTFGIPERYYASQHFAAVLALHPSGFGIEYAGMISQEGTERELEVYAIKIP